MVGRPPKMPRIVNTPPPPQGYGASQPLPIPTQQLSSLEQTDKKTLRQLQVPIPFSVPFKHCLVDIQQFGWLDDTTPYENLTTRYDDHMDFFYAVVNATVQPFMMTRAGRIFHLLQLRYLPSILILRGIYTNLCRIDSVSDARKMLDVLKSFFTTHSDRFNALITTMEEMKQTTPDNKPLLDTFQFLTEWKDQKFVIEDGFSIKIQQYHEMFTPDLLYTASENQTLDEMYRKKRGYSDMVSKIQRDMKALTEHHARDLDDALKETEKLKNDATRERENLKTVVKKTEQLKNAVKQLSVMVTDEFSAV